MSEWEFETWRIRDLGRSNAQVIAVNGDEFHSDDCPPFMESLTLASDDRWEVSEINGDTVLLKRPLVEE